MHRLKMCGRLGLLSEGTAEVDARESLRESLHSHPAGVVSAVPFSRKALI